MYSTAIMEDTYMKMICYVMEVMIVEMEQMKPMLSVMSIMSLVMIINFNANMVHASVTHTYVMVRSNVMTHQMRQRAFVTIPPVTAIISDVIMVDAFQKSQDVMGL